MTVKSWEDDWWSEPKTMTVHTDTPEMIVRYPKSQGGHFKVKVIQKPNPIGFRARLPGDKHPITSISRGGR